MAILLSAERKIFMATKMLVKEIEKHEVYSIILNPMLCFFVVVLLESSGRYVEAPNAFIFSLNNFESLAPFLSKLRPEKTKYAIDRRSDRGPKFGSDVTIYLDVNVIKYSKAALGAVYSVPASVKNKDTVLKGPGRNFSPDEVEVFYLDPSR